MSEMDCTFFQFVPQCGEFRAIVAPHHSKGFKCGFSANPGPFALVFLLNSRGLRATKDFDKNYSVLPQKNDVLVQIGLYIFFNLPRNSAHSDPLSPPITMSKKIELAPRKVTSVTL